MKKVKFLSFVLLVAGFMANAQDVDQASKAIDAEQYEKAKGLLKSIIKAKPDNGRATFLLGNVYLKQNMPDSAKVYFQKGLTAKDEGKLNSIGLAQLDLDAKNTSAAKAKFDAVTSDMRRRDFEEYIFIARAYMNSENPDYKKALEYLNLAKEKNANDAQVQLALGDAYYGDKNQNEAYVAYRNAYQADNTVIRAKMQLGVLLKGAKAYTEAVKAYNEVIALNPNYGPVYRELAETYYLWGNNEPSTYKENIKKALANYEKYMSLTDYSLTSRMRHADFLILTKEFKALEVEANKMKEIAGVNPRIMRYLGYSAYENGNIDAALKALNDYTSNPSSKVIALDYLFLGKAKLKKGMPEGAKVVDSLQLSSAVKDFKKAIEIDPLAGMNMNEIGKELYEAKLFGAAASVFEISASNPDSKNYLIDNFYLGNAIYYNNTFQGAKPDKVMLQKADTAFGNVLTASPGTLDALVFRARTNKLMENDEMMAKYYQDYVDAINAKGTEEVTKNKAKVIEAYNNIAAHYANFDKPKAKEYLNKTLALDPENAYALEALKLLK
ncbi:tetratricopeptide repeat protein [Flavobacterium capsici]|uniref:Tetratricopeptide repeat protein n=1 Tax=Flavobacterium capsici TaxID=3075618 RepID=A0AA96EZP2_9FLAO|nr:MULTISPECIES: tetratricopeptide repeat protein [unclassified Flavobacterium]WNM20055.1 tetratricopeptide repeat protein [Flavobacterium sp. PMR2A8]WNM21444.1 tetratricopeptide repeat protein [Flavobacterium sp. PMTSA4]